MEKIECITFTGLRCMYHCIVFFPVNREPHKLHCARSQDLPSNVDGRVVAGCCCVLSKPALILQRLGGSYLAKPCAKHRPCRESLGSGFMVPSFDECTILNSLNHPSRLSRLTGQERARYCTTNASGRDARQ